MPNAKDQRWDGLDALRAVAALLVICRHFEILGPDDTWFAWLLRCTGWVGWAGVDLFFALSGFLISNLLFREHAKFGEVQGLRFLARRAFKIYPGFYFLIALSLFGILEPQGVLDGPSVIGELFFLQNYVGSLWRHTWSLALEEHFYLLMTLLFCLPWHARLVKAWPLVALTFCAGCLAARVVTALFIPFDYDTHIQQTHVRIDGLFFGSLAGYLYNFHREPLTRFITRRRWLYNSATIAAISVAFVGELEKSFYAQTIALTILSIGFSMLTLGSVGGAFPAPHWKAVSLIGRCSYAIYLWHYVVLLRFLPGMQDYVPFRLSDPLRFGMYAVASVFMGIAMTRWVEEPALRLREKWFPAREAHARQAEVAGVATVA